MNDFDSDQEGDLTLAEDDEDPEIIQDPKIEIIKQEGLDLLN